MQQCEHGCYYSKRTCVLPVDHAGNHQHGPFTWHNESPGWEQCDSVAALHRVRCQLKRDHVGHHQHVSQYGEEVFQWA